MNIRNVTLRQIRAFVAIADAGSFAAAARRLHLTPSALSLLVKELEQCVEVRLLDRTTRATSLSAAGAEFYPLARKVLDDLSMAMESAWDLGRKRRGSLRVACTPLYAATLLPQLVQRYQSAYPAIAVYVLDALNQQVLARVASGEADLGIAPHRPEPRRQGEGDLVQETLLRDRIWLICRPDHALAQRPRATWAQVLREPFISLTPDFTNRLQSDLFRHSPSLALYPAHEVSLMTTALGMVQCGHGVTVLTGRALSLIGAFGLVARPLSAPVVYRQLSLFRKRGREPLPAAQSFAEFLHRAAQ